MTALDAFHVKQQVWENTIHHPLWHRYTETFTASVRGEYEGTTPDAPVGAPGFNETGPELDRRLRSTMELSETFYVSPLMNRMVTAASEQWPEDETVTPEDFPVDHGFLYIPGGLSMIDIRGQVEVAEVVTWSVRGGRVDFTYWTHKRHDSPSTKARAAWPDMPDWLPWHLTSLNLGDPLPRVYQIGQMLPPEVSEQIRYTSGPDGTTVGFFPKGWGLDELNPGFKTDHIMAWVVSALRIMQQPLASVEQTGLPANLRRNLMRHKRRLKNTRVTVIDFRRREGDFIHSGEREYTHRFLRRGHWRRQPYKMDDGTWDRRRIWIHPTIVGDPSLPLVLRDHVNALTR